MRCDARFAHLCSHELDESQLWASDAASLFFIVITPVELSFQSLSNGGIF